MQQIARKLLDKLNRILENYTSDNDTFIRGNLGLIFYYYHLYKVTETPAIKHQAEDLLEQVLANINSAKPSLVGPSLSTGGAGFGYTVNLMQREGFLEPEVEDEFEGLDDYLYKTASGLIEDDNMDFLHGALGVVHYFVEKKNTLYSDALIEKVCLRAVEEDTGCWFRNNLLRIDGKQIINFGLSHGLCGILLTLLQAYPESAHKELIARTVKEGIRFILKHKIDVDFSRQEYSFFPLIVTEGAREIVAPKRMGWCYGDLNEVLLFYRAGNLLGDENLLQLADLIGMQSMMRRDEQSTQAAVSSFGHGTAGLAQFCKALYRERELNVYKNGYEHWIERTIMLLDEELEKGAYTGKEDELLDGLPGIALTLLSYVSDRELAWSKALLL